MIVSSAAGDRLTGRRTWRSSLRTWAAARDAADASLTKALAAEAAWRHAVHPDLEVLGEAAARPTTQLWERGRSDDDFLALRVGVGSRPARVSATGDGGPAGRRLTVDDVPVTVGLTSLGVLGVCGDSEEVRQLVRSLVAQVAGWHSPRDVRLTLLASDTVQLREWAWVGLLPHARENDSVDVLCGVGSLAVEGQVRARVTELEAVLDERLGSTRGQPDTGPFPRHVLVLVGAGRLRGVPGVARLLSYGPEAGLTAICVDIDRADLPHECWAVVEVLGADATRRSAATVTGRDGETARVVPDQVGAGWADRFARALAPLRDATPSAAGTVPDQVNLVDLVTRDALEPAGLARRWTARPRSTTCVLGMGADGVFAVDLCHDGPHILVGGTTGSGKSELLQTLIASLAVGNAPDQLGFVLVDYKGGAAFAECDLLPHALGLVTDLDAHLAERALTSLTAELTRRERILSAAGVKDIDDYLAQGSRDDAWMPRLVLVIDEFRMLAEELPAFLEGVVRIAALGRSLGVHLVLATQRPAGVITADIAANVNLRIALRVRDRTDSEDVIESREAAAISPRTPGRALARSGPNPPVMFQGARIAGSAGGPARLDALRLSTESLGQPLPRPTRGSRGETDLAALVRSLRAASDRLGIRPAPRPWLPPLPDIVTLDQLTAPNGGWHAPYGVVDLPEQQAQRTVTWDLALDAHLLLVGSLRTGRTSALRTIAGSLAARFDARHVHLHAVDGGSGGLAALRQLPQAGVVAAAEEVGRCLRLLDLLAEEAVRRRALLGSAGLASLAEQHQYADPADHLPYLVLLVDGWETVAAQWDTVDHGRPVDVLQGLLRDGAAVGIRVAVTGDRGLLVSRLASLIRDKVVLRLSEPTDLMLAGIPRSALPGRQPPGRGVRVVDLAEVQLALLTADRSGPAQLAALRAIGEAAAQRGAAPDGRLIRLEPLPDLVRAEHLMRVVQPRRGWVPIGIGGDGAQPLGLDLDGTSALVAGPPRSGRSTVLRTVAMSLARAGEHVVTVTVEDDPSDVRATIDLTSRCFVLVDDVERLADTETEDVVLQWFKNLRHAAGGLVVAGTSADIAASFRGLATVARRGGQGVLLGPTSPLDGDLLGVRLDPPPVVRRPGRGVLVSAGHVTPIQVATMTLTPGAE
ncbi:MAG: FtsK/SpoIIIE domain-containing protein [Actinomycetales bacterium]